MFSNLSDRFKHRLKAKVLAMLYHRGYSIIHVGKSGVKGLNLISDLANLMPNGPVCFDVGANEGQTIDMLRAHLLNPFIHAFEPASATFKKLKDTHQGSDIEFHQCALGSKQSHLEFINYYGSNLSSFLEINRDKSNRFHNHKEIGRESVEITTVDAFAKVSNLRSIDLLKIDTQGYDLEVLKGASGMLAAGRINVVLIELNFAQLYQGQALATDIIGFLQQRGLHLVDFYDKVRQGNAIAWCDALFVREGEWNSRSD